MPGGEQMDWSVLQRGSGRDDRLSSTLNEDGRDNPTAEMVFGFFLVFGVVTVLALVAILWIVGAVLHGLAGAG